MADDHGNKRNDHGNMARAETALNSLPRGNGRNGGFGADKHKNNRNNGVRNGQYNQHGHWHGTRRHNSSGGADLNFCQQY